MPAESKSNYASGLVEALNRASEIAREHVHSEVLPLHLFHALLVPDDALPSRVLQAIGQNVHEVRSLVEAEIENVPAAARTTHEPKSSATLRAALQLADVERQVLEQKQVGEAHALIALLSSDGGLPGPLRKQLGVKRMPLVEAVRSLDRAEALASGEPGSTAAGDAGAPAGTLRGTVQYCTDLTAQARAGKIDPVLGRDAEVARLIEVLARRRKNNAVIVGEPGVGKTALVEGLALAIVSGRVPEHLKDRRILGLDLAAMVAGAKFKGEFEERFKKLLSEMEGQSDTAILFVDEIHSLLSAGAGGGGMDAANILKPALARGEIRVVGATTISEYRKHIEKDAAFARRFVRIDVEEPDEPTCLAILSGLKPGYEKHHKVTISDPALAAAVKLSRRYVPDRFLPDKAVDLVDEAAADVRILGEMMRLAFDAPAAAPAGPPDGPAAAGPAADGDAARQTSLDALAKALASRGYDVAPPAAGKEPAKGAEQAAALKAASDGLGREVGEREVARRVSLATGIPVHRMLSSERERLTHLEDHLHQRIIGQQTAVREVSEAVRRARAGLKRPNQPVGTFLFLGPTGTGKTELAKALAEFLFDDEKAMVRIDMSEYQQDFSIQRLIGAPPGFVGYEEGGALTEAVRRRPYSVILFDEIEKANPRCFDILLQVMDDGRLTDGQSRTVDFSNAVIILTSNFAGPWIAARVEAGEAIDPAQLREKMLQDGKFRPEFLNRFTSFVVFEPLNQEQVAKIVDLQVKALEKLLKERQVGLQLSPEARAHLAERGYDPAMGARPVRRLIDQKIANALAMRLIQDEKPAGKTARVELVEGDLRIALN